MRRCFCQTQHGENWLLLYSSETTINPFSVGLMLAHARTWTDFLTCFGKFQSFLLLSPSASSCSQGFAFHSEETFLVYVSHVLFLVAPHPTCSHGNSCPIPLRYPNLPVINPIYADWTTWLLLCLRHRKEFLLVAEENLVSAWFYGISWWVIKYENGNIEQRQTLSANRGYKDNQRLLFFGGGKTIVPVSGFMGDLRRLRHVGDSILGDWNSVTKTNWRQKCSSLHSIHFEDTDTIFYLFGVFMLNLGWGQCTREGNFGFFRWIGSFWEGLNNWELATQIAPCQGKCKSLVKPSLDWMF